LANLPDTVLQYRQHDQSVSEIYQVQQTAKRRQCCERAWQRRGRWASTSLRNRALATVRFDDLATGL
jgi:hypothetical protein